MMQAMLHARLPFEALNLRWNPFGEPSREDRAVLAVTDVEVWSRWLEGRVALQLLGDSGHGKTTHLLALGRLRPEACFLRAEEEQRDWPEASLLLVDEIQLAPRRRRRQLFRRGLPLALGTHDDLTRELERHDYRVETVRLEGLTLERLLEICRRRLEWARLGPGPIPSLGEAAARCLLARHGDDVRSIEDDLYDQVQGLVRQANRHFETRREMWHAASSAWNLMTSPGASISQAPA
jgi:hypothetical protein